MRRSGTSHINATTTYSACASQGQIKDTLRYTIVEERSGPGSAKGWGRLKAGGWIALDWVKKV